jgi:hypothetical protein
MTFDAPAVSQLAATRHFRLWLREAQPVLASDHWGMDDWIAFRTWMDARRERATELWMQRDIEQATDRFAFDECMREHLSEIGV